MKLAHSLKLVAVSVLALCLQLFSGAVLADSLTPPVLLNTSTASDGPTLGIPRWKGYMLETDPNQFWACYANGGMTRSNISYTTDGGTTWSTEAIQIEPAGYLDMHCSVFGRNGNLYTTWPGLNSITFRKFSAPVHSNADGGPLVSIAGTTGSHRSNLMVQNTGRIWLFTRLSYASTDENVLYNYSDNEGASWTHGTAYATNFNSVRIGSMPYVNGNPALVVEYLADGRGFEYYHWNGSSFVARPDHSIYAANLGQTRVFTHNVVHDTVFHLIFGLGTQLHHVWKNFNNGNGTWNHQVIDNSSTTVENEWFPTSTVRGDDLYLFYTRKSTTSGASSMIYYRKWTQSTQTWTDPILVSTDAANISNRDPNTCFHVPDNSPYVPVIWRSGDGPFGVYFAKVVVGLDTVPPAAVYDLGVAPNPSPDSVMLRWTAPGGDGTSGRAAAYDVRFAEFSLTTGQWQAATPIANSPVPKPAGQMDSCSITGLSPGTSYYFALKSEDVSSNWSDLSNVVSFTTPTDVPDGSQTGGLPRISVISGNSPNPFSSSTEIQFSLSSRSHVNLTIFDLLGRRVATVLENTLPAGSFAAHWNGRNSQGEPVGAGVYFSRLITDERTSSHAMVLIR